MKRNFHRFRSVGQLGTEGQPNVPFAFVLQEMLLNYSTSDITLDVPKATYLN